MKVPGDAVVLIDEDEDDVASAVDETNGLAVINRYDHEALGKKIVLEQRHIILISADPCPLTAIDMAFFAAMHRISRIGVLSANNSLPTGMTTTPFFISGVFTFFSNGGERGVLIDRPVRRNCSLCNGTGRIMFGLDEEDICPGCEETRKGKNWVRFLQRTVVQSAPTVIEIPISF